MLAVVAVAAPIKVQLPVQGVMAAEVLAAAGLEMEHLELQILAVGAAEVEIVVVIHLEMVATVS